MIALSPGSLCDVCAEEYGPHNYPHSIPCGEYCVRVPTPDSILEPTVLIHTCFSSRTHSMSELLQQHHREKLYATRSMLSFLPRDVY